MDDVQHPDLTGCLEVRAELAEVSKAHSAEAVIDGDDHHIAAETKVGSIPAGVGPGPSAEAPAMQPEHHLALAAIVERWGPDVQYEAVFTLFWILTSPSPPKTWHATLCPRRCVSSINACRTGIG
jgi:hypothetical protein